MLVSAIDRKLFFLKEKQTICCVDYLPTVDLQCLTGHCTFFTRMRTVFPQISKIDLYVGGELLSPVDDKRLIGKCNFPDRVVCIFIPFSINK